MHFAASYGLTEMLNLFGDIFLILDYAVEKGR
jgi:hypothetical protein